MPELPPRQKSQRLLKRTQHRGNVSQFQQFKAKTKNVSHISDLLPGLNDIADGFEALPEDMIKYMTLLKEIDAKCVNTVPRINQGIVDYIDTLHKPDSTPSNVTKLKSIKQKLELIVPCLEEKMHVTSVAQDVINKHMFRINNDYKIIIQNNEVPESIRIGPLNHPAMIMDSSSPSDQNNPNRSAQSSRSETRREALAARKTHKDEVPVPVNTSHHHNNNNNSNNNNNNNHHHNHHNHHNHQTSGPGHATKPVPLGAVNTRPVAPPTQPHQPVPVSVKESTPMDKRKRPRKDQEEISRPSTPKRKPKSKEDNQSNDEPTYCYCNQVSFGEMVGCDGDDCKREWFHLPCIGFKNPPKGKWYCDDCVVKRRKV